MTEIPVMAEIALTVAPFCLPNIQSTLRFEYGEENAACCLFRTENGFRWTVFAGSFSYYRRFMAWIDSTKKIWRHESTDDQKATIHRRAHGE
jgi:hypothetical protein